jgi:hypothetical protein
LSPLLIMLLLLLLLLPLLSKWGALLVARLKTTANKAKSTKSTHACVRRLTSTPAMTPPPNAAQGAWSGLTDLFGAYREGKPKARQARYPAPAILFFFEPADARAR